MTSQPTSDNSLANLPADILGQIIGQTPAHHLDRLEGASHSFLNNIVEQSDTYWKKRLEVDHGLKYSTIKELYEAVTRSKEYPKFQASADMKTFFAGKGGEGIVMTMSYDRSIAYIEHCERDTSGYLRNIASEIATGESGRIWPITEEVTLRVHNNELGIYMHASYPTYDFSIPLYNRAPDIVKELRQLASKVDELSTKLHLGE
jgi:hypothetical protein